MAKSGGSSKKPTCLFVFLFKGRFVSGFLVGFLWFFVLTGSFLRDDFPPVVVYFEGVFWVTKVLSKKKWFLVAGQEKTVGEEQIILVSLEDVLFTRPCWFKIYI